MTGGAEVLVAGMVSSTSPSLLTCGALPPSHLSDFLPTPATVHKKLGFYNIVIDNPVLLQQDTVSL
jgi:hypothetical protein